MTFDLSKSLKILINFSLSASLKRPLKWYFLFESLLSEIPVTVSKSSLNDKKLIPGPLSISELISEIKSISFGKSSMFSLRII